MNWVSIVVVLVLALTTFRAYRNGFVRELVSLCATILAIPMAGIFYDDMYPKVLPIVDNEALAYLVAFLAILIGVLILGQVAAHLLKQGVNLLNFGAADQLAGGAFGLITGILICQAVLIALVLFPARTCATISTPRPWRRPCSMARPSSSPSSQANSPMASASSSIPSTSAKARTARLPHNSRSRPAGEGLVTPPIAWGTQVQTGLAPLCYPRIMATATITDIGTLIERTPGYNGGKATMAGCGTSVNQVALCTDGDCHSTRSSGNFRTVARNISTPPWRITSPTAKSSRPR